MDTEPQIKVLSSKRRQILFIGLVVVFLVTLPSMIFHMSGYRLNFDNDETSITTTGGVYVTTDNLEVEVYVDEKRIDNPRLFRSAYYIQNIEAGQHRVVVQRSDLQTWVKNLPVDPHIVIEAAAFNMPKVSQVRPITEYVTPGGRFVFRGVASTTNLFPTASTTVPIYATTTTGTSSYLINEEHIFVKSLFSTTSTTSRSVFDKLLEEVDRFRFATTSSSSEISDDIPNEVVMRGNVRLVEREGEIFATWTEGVRNIPYYFCINKNESSSTSVRYGEHVADSIAELSLSTSTPLMIDGDRVCRPEIKLNHLRQDVYFYNFFPGNSDLILLQLEDGLYVTEIDDRAWQNTQLLYPGKDFRVVIENNSIFILENGLYFEVMTRIDEV